MGAITVSVRCSQCLTLLDEPPGLPSNQRRPCPNCGSTGRNSAQATGGELRPVGTLRLRGFRDRARKWFVEVIKGADFFQALGRWVRKLRVINREADTYVEKVVDPQSGAILQDTGERLSTHTGHGSARKP